MEIEDEFVIEIPDTEAYNFHKVGEVITYVSHHPMAK
jgi:acyl carrier protein